MKLILLHGLGQTPAAWDALRMDLQASQVEAPSIFSGADGVLTYPKIYDRLEKRYGDEQKPLCLCGLSLGAVLALDFALRHNEQVASLILCAPQYRVPKWLIEVQNLMFRCMPSRTFADMGMSRGDMISLTRSMKTLDFTDRLKNLTCPVTILCGEKDTVNQKAAKELAALLPQAKLAILTNAGHEINRDNPKVLAAIVNEEAPW